MKRWRWCWALLAVALLAACGHDITNTAVAIAGNGNLLSVRDKVIICTSVSSGVHETVVALSAGSASSWQLTNVSGKATTAANFSSQGPYAAKVAASATGNEDIFVIATVDGRENRASLTVNCSAPPPPAPQCSDGIDNADPEDALADAADPGCHTDGNANNLSSYNPQDNDETNSAPPLAPQCSNTFDDPDPEDLLADAADPGCHTDGNAANPGSYNPQDNDETNSSPPPAPQCSNGFDDPDQEDLLADAADPGCHTDGNAGNPGSYNPQDNDETNVPVTTTYHLSPTGPFSLVCTNGQGSVTVNFAAINNITGAAASGVVWSIQGTSNSSSGGQAIWTGAGTFHVMGTLNGTVVIDQDVQVTGTCQPPPPATCAISNFDYNPVNGTVQTNQFAGATATFTGTWPSNCMIVWYIDTSPDGKEHIGFGHVDGSETAIQICTADGSRCPFYYAGRTATVKGVSPGQFRVTAHVVINQNSKWTLTNIKASHDWTTTP